MTPLRAVMEDHRLSSSDLEIPSPPRQPTCQHPHCSRNAEHRHHIVARSQTNGPKDLIKIDDLHVINVIDLCFTHHDALESSVNGCASRLRWLNDKLGWGWYNRATVWNTVSEGIWWTDHKSKTMWKFIGFVKGEYVID